MKCYTYVMDEISYIDTVVDAKLQLRPRPKNDPFLIPLSKDNILSYPDIKMGDLEYLEPVSKALIPVICDAQSRYFFKPAWQAWVIWEKGGASLARILRAHPTWWENGDFPRSEAKGHQPLWRAMLASDVTDARLIPIWKHLPPALLDSLLPHVIHSQRPALAEMLWKKGARWGTDSHAMLMAATAWVTPDYTKISVHLGHPLTNGKSLNTWDEIAVKTGDAEIDGKKMADVAVLWATRWADRLAGHPVVNPLFPVTLATPGKDNQIVEYSLGAYLIRHGMENTVSAFRYNENGAMRDILLAQLRGVQNLGMNFATIPPPGNTETTEVSWAGYLQQQLSHSGLPEPPDEVTAWMRQAQTHAPAGTDAHRTRLRV